MKIDASDRIRFLSNYRAGLFFQNESSGDLRINYKNFRLPIPVYLSWMPWMIILLLFNLSCMGDQVPYKSPPGYDITNPEIFSMPAELHEISGIAFNQKNPDTIYTEQDEKGKLFRFKLGDEKMVVSRFSGPGDFEDVTICNGYVVMLRSDGVLFSFPLSETYREKADQVQKWENLLPSGEYEGLYSIDSTRELFVLCKKCKGDKAGKSKAGFIFKIDPNGKINSSGEFKIDVKEITKITGEKKINFHPSALAFNSFTNEWFVLSSVNKLLLITDKNWNIKTAYPLNPALFLQPEGIAFDNENNLYISNEGNALKHGTILKFIFKKDPE